MRYLGKMHDLRWNPPLQKLIIGRDIMLDDDGRPTEMPVFLDGTFLFGVIEQGLGENVFLCESTEDVHDLLNKHAVWFSAHLPESSQTFQWESKTGHFSEIEMHRLEMYPTITLRRMMLRHMPLEAMRALAELLLHEDQRLDELLRDHELTYHWKGWSSEPGFDSRDMGYVCELDKKALTVMQQVSAN